MKLSQWWQVIRRPLPAWWPQSAALDDTPLASDRIIILDTETSGFSAQQDQLLSLAAVTYEAGALSMGAQWYATLNTADAQGLGDSVLVHRLTASQLADGMDLNEGITTLAQFVGAAPVLAYHHGHDRNFIKAAMYRSGYPMLPWRWLEAADVFALAWPAAGLEHAGLDDWLQWHEIVVEERHHALEDAWVTAMLWLKAVPALAAQGITTRVGLVKAMRSKRALIRQRTG